MRKNWILAVCLSSFLIPSLVFGATEISDGSVKALYHFNGDSTDASGNGLNGTDTNITYNSGFLGSNFASFNGTNSHIATADTGLPTATSSRTLIAWVRSSDYSSTATRNWIIYSYGQGASDKMFNFEINTNRLCVNIYGTEDCSPTLTLATSTWILLGMTINGTNIEYFQNGVSKGTTAVGTMNTALSAGSIGYDWHFTNSYFGAGDIDEFAILNKVLSASDQLALYNSGAGSEICVSVGCGGGGGGSSTSTTATSSAVISPQLDFMLQLFVESVFVLLGLSAGYVLLKKRKQIL